MRGELQNEGISYVACTAGHGVATAALTGARSNPRLGSAQVELRRQRGTLTCDFNYEAWASLTGEPPLLQGCQQGPEQMISHATELAV